MNTSPKIRRGWGALVIVGAAACSGSGFDDAVPGDERDEPNIEVSNGSQTQDNAAATPSSSTSTPPPPPPSIEAGAGKVDAATPPDPGIPGPWDGGWIPPIDFDAGALIPKSDGGYKPPKNDGGFGPKLDAGIGGPFDGSFLPF